MFFGGGGFPFGGFEETGGQGMPGRGGPPKEVDNSKFYDLLDVEKTASEQEIKKAFRKKALKEHPDRGGDKEKFQALQGAYEVLADKEKRDVYDKYGEDGLKEGGAGMGNMNDIFGGLFGGMGGAGRGPRGPKKGKPVMHPLKVTLEEVYNGKTTKIAVNRERICKACDGKGGKDGAVQTCSGCGGRGNVRKMRMLGPGMYQQTEGPCDDCRGTGEVIDEKNKCKTCNGKKVCKEKKILEAAIDKGAPNDQQYTFHGEADEFPGQEAGDVVIVVKEQPHKKFKRRGADIVMEKEISLHEALTGVDFVINHLDGSKLRIKNNPGEVIKPDDIKTVPEKGLPFHKCSYKFGNLYVLFKVKFPDKLDSTQVSAVNTALASMKRENGGDVEMSSQASETVNLVHYSESQRNTHAQGGTEARDSDDDEDDPRGGRGGQRVQCQQQ